MGKLIFQRVKQLAGEVPVMCLIRCRSGDFNYSEDEIQVMVEDIEHLKGNGADGFVIGALDLSADIDVAKSSRLQEACGSLPVTFHRAFDHSVEPITTALLKVKDIGCNRILSSGRKENVTAGGENLAMLVREARSLGIIVMPGGGITCENIGHVARKTDAKELHMSASVKDPQPIPGMGEQMTVDVQLLEKALGKIRSLEMNERVKLA